MVFDFILKETRKTTIPVRANTRREADVIFDEWYGKHISDPKDLTIYDLLDEGDQGIEIIRCTGKDDALYNPEDIKLPEEKSEPPEPLYDMYITFADKPGSLPVFKPDMPIADVTSLIFNYATSGYLVYPNGGMNNDALVTNRVRNTFHIRLVPKGDK